MEFGIPLTKFDPNHVRWGNPRVGPFRRTIPFAYEEGQIHFHSVILSLQPLKIVEMDVLRNQIVLEESRKLPFLSKIEQFQTLVQHSLLKHGAQWTEGCKKATEVAIPLQPLLKNKRLCLYLSTQADSLSFFNEGVAVPFSDTSIKPGDLIRITVKLQGLSLQMVEDNIWTGKSRIQHHILQIYKVSKEEDDFA
jgi:hypothetical protein